MLKLFCSRNFKATAAGLNISLDKDELTLIFRGECSKCLILNRCTAWIEEQIKKDLKKNVKVNAIRKKPYFQDV